MIGQLRFQRDFAGLFAAASLIVTALLADSAKAQPTITNLGVLSGGTDSIGNALSADGTTVTGSSNSSVGTRAFLWTAGGGIQSLGILSGGSYSSASAVSADGSVVTGISAQTSGNNRAFRWTAATGMQSLGVLGTGSASASNGINSDGSVIAGFSYTSGFTGGRAFRWTAAGGMQNLGNLPGGVGSDASSVSADGSVVAGVDSVSGSLRAFRWTSSSGMQDIGVIPAGDSSEALGLSPDGSMATGDSGDDLTGVFHAFRWSSGSGMQDLGVLTGGNFSQGRAISADNSTIVGTSSTSNGDRAFLWTQEIGMVDLNNYLSALGLNLTGWTLNFASGISTNGSAIAGYGTFNGAERAFLVNNIPALLRGDIDLDGHVTIADVAALMTALSNLSGYRIDSFFTVTKASAGGGRCRPRRSDFQRRRSSIDFAVGQWRRCRRSIADCRARAVQFSARRCWLAQLSRLWKAANTCSCHVCAAPSSMVCVL